ncbi:MAG TPA: aldo/keto reductase [Burkholderiales bacterium]|nr:aldo/keto reductase [Burkholderiales bacterium]
MNDDTKPASRLFTRREMLAMTAGLGAAALGITPAGAATAAAQALLTRPIPRTGEQLAVVGLGTAIVFDIEGDAPRIAERRAVIETLLAGGARLIDTAPSYGAAESVVGDLLSEMKARDKVFLATKVRVAARERAVAEIEQSLKRLRTGKIDLMQIHNVGFVGREETASQLALLREWKERGVFRYLGVTHSQNQPRANDRLIEILRTEKLDFIQVNYSMAERSVEERLLAVAADTGTAVLVNLPFARARLFRAVRGRPVPTWAAEFDASTWGQFFLKYILAAEAVNAVIPGTDRPQYMVDNLNAGRGRLPDAAMRRRMVNYIDSLS